MPNNPLSSYDHSTSPSTLKAPSQVFQSLLEHSYAYSFAASPFDTLVLSFCPASKLLSLQFHRKSVTPPPSTTATTCTWPLTQHYSWILGRIHGLCNAMTTFPTMVWCVVLSNEWTKISLSCPFWSCSGISNVLHTYNTTLAVHAT